MSRDTKGDTALPSQLRTSKLSRDEIMVKLRQMISDTNTPDDRRKWAQDRLSSCERLSGMSYTAVDRTPSPAGRILNILKGATAMIVILVVASLAGGIGQEGGRIVGERLVGSESISPLSDPAKLEKMVAQTAGILNARTPQKVDDNVTLVRVEQDGLRLRYVHETVDPSVVPPDDTIQSRVCGNTKMANMVGLGLSYGYAYYDSSGMFLSEVQVTSC